MTEALQFRTRSQMIMIIEVCIQLKCILFKSQDLDLEVIWNFFTLENRKVMAENVKM